MAGTVTFNIDLLPAYKRATGEIPIQVGPDRWVAHHGTVVPPDDEPVWPLADDYDVHNRPLQGQWTEADYLSLGVSKIIEMSDGRLEFLPVSNELHQQIVMFFVLALQPYLNPQQLGSVMFAPFPMVTLPGKYREPDVLVMLAENAARKTNERWHGADFVIEVVSKDDPGRDYQQKRVEYAEAGIREYWIVDPLKKAILVLSREDDSYREIGTFTEDERAQSVLLKGFGVEVRSAFADWDR